jgi:hypothetical protein
LNRKVNHFVIEKEATSVFVEALPYHSFEKMRTFLPGARLGTSLVMSEPKNRLFFERQLAYVFMTMPIERASRDSEAALTPSR